jgi:cytochrome bd-type quinol oxidase subunit 2
MEARGESIIRARRREAGPPAKPTRSPLFGEPPFYGYNWVFYADLLAGALTGFLAVRWRSRNDPAGARVVWMVVGVLLGAAGAAAVFLPFYLLNAMLSIGFSAMPPAMLFGLTLAVIVLTVLSVAVSRRRG